VNSELIKSSIIYGSVALCFLVLGIIVSGLDPSVGISSGACSVKRIRMYGQLTTYPQSLFDGTNPLTTISSNDIVEQLEIAKNDTSVKAVILDVDSPGGNIVAGEEVKIALESLGKPSVALIRSQGLSAAYFASLGASKIIASQGSDVGSIGVIISYLENSAKNKKEGIQYVEVASGKFKGVGSPNKALSVEEKSLFVRDIEIMWEYFANTVAKSRNIPIEKVKTIADGSSVLGVMAKDLGLIGVVGGVDEAVGYFATELKKETSDITICKE
jgi:protease IV